jgi:O-antigen ligase
MRRSVTITGACALLAACVAPHARTPFAGLMGLLVLFMIGVAAVVGVALGIARSMKKSDERSEVRQEPDPSSQDG